jgi:hypothetical protein
MNIIIDVVFTYVDHTDLDWQLLRKYATKYDYDPNLNNCDSNLDCRFNNINTLKYAVKSVLVYLPFVNMIYIVLNTKPPKWLDQLNHNDRNKIKLVYHHEIDSLVEYLPTFNSHTIEAHLHNIKNLSEYFIYLNDDVFISQPMQISDFITTDNKVKLNFDKTYTKQGIPNPDEIGFRSAWKNTNNWLNKMWVNEKRLKTSHAPIVLKKSILSKIWDLLPNEMINTSKTKFRAINNYNITGGLYTYYMLYNNMAITNTDKNTHTIYLSTDYDENIFQMNKIKDIQNNIFIFCIEDSFDDPNNDKNTIEFLQSYYD